MRTTMSKQKKNLAFAVAFLAFAVGQAQGVEGINAADTEEQRRPGRNQENYGLVRRMFVLGSFRSCNYCIFWSRIVISDATRKQNIFSLQGAANAPCSKRI